MSSPVHRTIFLLDVEGYGADDRTTPDRVALRDGLYEALRAAFAEAEVPWDGLRREDCGDGVFVLVPAECGKAVFVERVPLALAAAVAAHNARHPEPARRMRLRMALHAGEVTYDEHGVTSPAIIKAFRLLDAPELKAALAGSAGVLVLITSAWYFGEVVRHSPAANAATYRRVRVSVKETVEDAWIARPDDPYPPKSPHAGGKRRTRWVGAAAALIALAAAAALLVPVLNHARSTAGPGTPTTAVRPAWSFLGDPRTANPCALTYADALSSYGIVETSDDYGNFNRCDALVYLSKDRKNYVDVLVQFASDADDPGLPAQQDGLIGIQRPPAGPDSCSRTLLLPDDAQVVVRAEQNGDEKADLCGMAEAVMASALSKLRDKGIERRSLENGSLAQREACPLLDAASITPVLGNGPIQQTRTFADWGCRWDYTDRLGVVKVIFDRTAAEQLKGDPLPPMSGFPARLQRAERSDTSCTVVLGYRTYVDSKHVQTDELAVVDVEKSDERPDRLCEPARRLAAVVAQRLRR